MGLNHSPRIVTNGLVGYWDAANKRSYPGSGTTWNDLSGNGNDGTNSGTITYSSSNSGVLTYNGGTTTNTSYANTSSLNLDYVTISAWIYPTAVKQAEVIMKNNAVTTSIPYGFQIWNNNNIYCHANTATTGWLEVIAGTYTINKWYNIGMTYDGANFNTYINGVQTTSTAKTGTIIKNTSPLYIAYYFSSSGYTGNISNIQLYNRGLSAKEILQNYNAIRGRFGI